MRFGGWRLFLWGGSMWPFSDSSIWGKNDIPTTFTQNRKWAFSFVCAGPYSHHHKWKSCSIHCIDRHQPSCAERCRHDETILIFKLKGFLFPAFPAWLQIASWKINGDNWLCRMQADGLQHKQHKQRHSQVSWSPNQNQWRKYMALHHFTTFQKDLLELSIKPVWQRSY